MIGTSILQWGEIADGHDDNEMPQWEEDMMECLRWNNIGIEDVIWQLNNWLNI